jgi:hypothetical protein
LSSLPCFIYAGQLLLQQASSDGLHYVFLFHKLFSMLTFNENIQQRTAAPNKLVYEDDNIN